MRLIPGRRSSAQLEGDSPVPCPLCENTTSRHVLSEQGLRLYQCRQCRFLFVVPRPDAEELKRMYSEEYFTGENMDAATLNFRTPVFLQCLERLKRVRPERGRLLDVGCWTGDFLEHAQLAGWSVAGLELSTRAAHYAQQNGRNVRCGTMENICEDAQFDALTLLDVLEHMPDPRMELAHARRLLKPGGILVVRVPNTNFHLPKARICSAIRIPDKGLHMRFHLNHFTPTTLGRTLQTSGFKVLTFEVGAPEYIAHTQWATPRAKRAYVHAAQLLHSLVRIHVGNIVAVYATRCA